MFFKLVVEIFNIYSERKFMKPSILRRKNLLKNIFSHIKGITFSVLKKLNNNKKNLRKKYKIRLRINSVNYKIKIYAIVIHFQHY